MNRILKTLGLAAFAAMAMSAMFAASASAVELKSGITGGALTGTAVHATQYGTVTENVFKAFGEELNCTNHSNTFTGNTDADGTSKTLTITPSYNDCYVVGASHSIVRPVTVTMNGCAYVFNEPTGATPTGTVDLECSGSNQVEIHAYTAQSTHTGNHSFTLCTETLGAQKKLGTIEYHNVAGNPDDITVTVRAKGIKATKHGLCGSQETTTAEYISNLTLTSNTHDLWF